MSVENHITRISSHLGTIDLGKPRLAQALLKARNEVNWKETDYGSWRGFCNVKVKMSYSSIYRYVRVAEMAEKLDYTLDDMRHIVIVIGWSRFYLGLMDCQKFLYVNEFIDKYKDLNLNKRVTYESKETDLVTFSFALPAEAAARLTDELIIRGMRVSKQNRTNASAAMEQLMKDVFPE